MWTDELTCRVKLIGNVALVKDLRFSCQRFLCFVNEIKKLFIKCNDIVCVNVRGVRLCSIFFSSDISQLYICFNGIEMRSIRV